VNGETEKDRDKKDLTVVPDGIAEALGHVTGVVFNIQRYSIHDGPGIRTTVFMKGCPLRCMWCQNPESQAFKPELFFNKEKCTGCGQCAAVCPEKAVEILEGKAVTDRSVCTACGLCVEGCPAEAREIMGKSMTADEVVEEVMKDEVFYRTSGGGVTLSGGEPFAQADFSASILSLCKAKGVHTAIETCGYARWEIAEKVLPFVDLVLFDLKQMSGVEHLKLTGAPNSLILQNLKRIRHERHIPVLLRIPVIPGYNDSSENIRATSRFVAHELDPSMQVHLIPYHRLGVSKTEQLEMPCVQTSIAPPDEEDVLHLKELMEMEGLKKVIIGG
jgi:pyruvate formate lyase activating enzyme